MKIILEKREYWAGSISPPKFELERDAPTPVLKLQADPERLMGLDKHNVKIVMLLLCENILFLPSNYGSYPQPHYTAKSQETSITM
jgi:hypothetical protein